MDTCKREPLRLRTDPAGEGTSCLHDRRPRSQGPDGLDRASCEDDGRLRQVVEPSVDDEHRNPIDAATAETIAAPASGETQTESSSDQAHASTLEPTAACGTVTVRSGSRPSCSELTSPSLVRITPDAPRGANTPTPDCLHPVRLTRLSPSAIRLRTNTHCVVTGLFSGVYRVSKFAEPDEGFINE